MPLGGVFPAVDRRDAPGHLHGHGETLAQLDRDVSDGEGANALQKTWNGEQIQQEQSASAEIIASFGRQAVQLVGDYATSRTQELRSEAREESDPLKRHPFDIWSFGMSGVTGALTAGQGITSAVITNMGGAYTSTVVQGQNPNNEIVAAAVETLIGYPIG